MIAWQNSTQLCHGDCLKSRCKLPITTYWHRLFRASHQSTQGHVGGPIGSNIPHLSQAPICGGRAGTCLAQSPPALEDRSLTGADKSNRILFPTGILIQQVGNQTAHSLQ